jgi:hypothetical protein
VINGVAGTTVNVMQQFFTGKMAAESGEKEMMEVEQNVRQPLARAEILKPQQMILKTIQGLEKLGQPLSLVTQISGGLEAGLVLML